MSSIANKFIRDEAGATAVEFAIICLPFFLLIFCIIEVALGFFAGAALDASVKNVSRDIRTGRAQVEGLGQAEMKRRICEQLLDLFDCSKSLRLDVSTVSNMAAAANQVKDDAHTAFSLGNAGDYVVVRAALPWNFGSAFLSPATREPASVGHFLSSATLFRNEPFHE